MLHRASSPAASEHEIDISHSLLNRSDRSSSEDGVPDQHPDRKARMVDTEGMLDTGSESDDADRIAETQAASNRKSSNLKGRTVKKGGGFQAMSLNSSLLKAISRKGFTV